MSRPEPPSGQPPPVAAVTPGGVVDLEALAAEACSRYIAEFPDERERYGDVGQEWCRHDLQHVLNWAIGDAHHGLVDLEQQMAWLARILEARDFPLDRLARSLVLCADVMTERHDDAVVAARLREVAPTIGR